MSLVFVCPLSLFVVCFYLLFVFICRLSMLVHDNGNCWFLVVLGQSRVYLFVHGGTGSVEGGTGWYMVVLGQCGVESLNLENEN